MRNNRLILYVVPLGVMVAGGLLGGFNYHWAHESTFPVYGYAIDALVVPLVIAAILYIRRLKIAQADEFTVAKKRLAAQNGLIAGFLLYAVMNLMPIVFPHAYDAFVQSLGGAGDAFAIGRLIGMVPFVVGLLYGQTVAWLKYR